MLTAEHSLNIPPVRNLRQILKRDSLIESVSRLHFLDVFPTGDQKTFCPIIALKNRPLNQLKTRTSQRYRYQVRSNPCEGVLSGFSMQSSQFEGILLFYVNSVLKSLERFSYDLEMKAREQNRNDKRTEIERFDWFIERTDKRVWLFIG